MDKVILIVNPGSASKKYALFAGGAELARGHYERHRGEFPATLRVGDKVQSLNVSAQEYQSAAGHFLQCVETMFGPKTEVGAVALRVVAPGEYFFKTRLIDADYLTQLKRTRDEVPLHTTALQAEIEQLRPLLPDCPFYGLSDSAFHESLPERAWRYALPKEALRLGLRRFGYHGISVKWSVREAARLLHNVPEKMVICHLGGGCSVTAVLRGRSIDTSMGFTPLEGVPMGSRVGDIDPGAVIELAQALQLSPAQLDEYLNTKSGLLGLSGKTSEVRELLELENEGDRHAALALEIFTYRIKKYIGAYMAALGGVDLLVFTGTIGERSAPIRRRICEGLERFGIAVDTQRNEAAAGTGFIESGQVKIAVIASDELREMADEAAALT